MESRLLINHTSGVNNITYTLINHSRWCEKRTLAKNLYESAKSSDSSDSDESDELAGTS